MMANGTLVRVLIHTDVTKYLYFKAVDGSYVFNKGKVLLWFTLAFFITLLMVGSASDLLFLITSLIVGSASDQLFRGRLIGSQGSRYGHGGTQISTHGHFWETPCSQVLHLCPRLWWKWPQNPWRLGLDKGHYKRTRFVSTLVLPFLFVGTT